jgi:hypothetical protein
VLDYSLPQFRAVNQRRPRLLLLFVGFCFARQSGSKKRAAFFQACPRARGVQNRAINSLTLGPCLPSSRAPLRPKDVHFRVSTAFVCVFANAERERDSLRSHSRARLINKLNTIQLPDIDVKCLFTSNHRARRRPAVCLLIKFNCAYAFIVPAEEEEDKNAGNFPPRAHCFVKVSAAALFSLLPALLLCLC